MQTSRDLHITQRGDILDRSDLLVMDSRFSLEEFICDPLDDLESKSESLTSEDEDDRLSIWEIDQSSQIPQDNHTTDASNAASTLEKAKKLKKETQRVRKAMEYRRMVERRAATETIEQRRDRLKKASLSKKSQQTEEQRREKAEYARNWRKLHPGSQRTVEQRRKQAEQDRRRRENNPETETQRLRRIELARKRPLTKA